MAEDTIRRDLERATHARDLLNNPLLTETLDAMRDHYVAQLITASPETILTAQASVHAVDHFRELLREEVKTGTIAQDKLNYLEAERKRHADLIKQKGN